VNDHLIRCSFVVLIRGRSIVLHLVNLPTDTKQPERVLEFIEKNKDLIFDVMIEGRLS